MGTWTYSTATTSELDAIARISGLSFAFAPEDSKKWIERSGLANVRVVRDAAGAVAGQLLRTTMGQFFGGRSVPTVGVAGVAVPPEGRGGGVATFLMTSFLREVRGDGVPISTLYPATQPLYRRVGFEQAGSRFEVRIPVARLGGEPRPEMRPATEADRPAVAECYQRMASHWDGWLDRGRYVWDRVWMPRGQAALGWVAPGAGGGIDGYAVLQQSRPDAASARHDVTLMDIGFRSAAGGRRVLGFLAGFASMGLDLVMHCGPTHPVLLMLREQRWTMTLRDFWMVRIVDVPGAIAARGYAPGAGGAVDLDVDDPLFPENAGRWRVHAEGGRAEAVRGGEGSVRLDIGALGALYAGYISAGGLRQAGRLYGDDAAVRAAATVFPAGSPGMPDMF
ncbi:MAG: GNAT family N-acetyltransferase [Phycisphaerales bacterium]|nr:GNAT family N-acetyltransferase [Phycisphaerales bacterium]